MPAAGFPLQVPTPATVYRDDTLMRRVGAGIRRAMHWETTVLFVENGDLGVAYPVGTNLPRRGRFVQNRQPVLPHIPGYYSETTAR